MNALEQRVNDLTQALRDLISHAQECERELDVLMGLGSDAGSGYSVNICEAQKVLNAGAPATSSDADTVPQLKVTFLLDAEAYVHLGTAQMGWARQDAWELIFKRAEQAVLASQMRAAMKSSGNSVHDALLKGVLEEELAAIRQAAQSATYEFINMPDPE